MNFVDESKLREAEKGLLALGYDPGEIGVATVVYFNTNDNKLKIIGIDAANRTFVGMGGGMVTRELTFEEGMALAPILQLLNEGPRWTGCRVALD